jgi:hypothetical protein
VTRDADIELSPAALHELTTSLRRVLEVLHRHDSTAGYIQAARSAEALLRRTGSPMAGYFGSTAEWAENRHRLEEDAFATIVSDS